jgi:hypothetical protein
MITLDPAAYDTDKSPADIALYEQEFGVELDQPMTLLELGIQRGGSMRMWLDLLPKAQIAGLDLNRIEVEPDPRLHIYQGFQQDPVVLDRIAAEVAPEGFDVILDDASHIGQYTAQSFWHLFPKHLKPGGVYVIDDWGCAYWPDWADGHAYTGPIGPGGSAPVPSLTAGQPGRVERVRQHVRASARPIAAKLDPATRKRLMRAYMALEGATMRRRMKSHDYGMAGMIKQLIDALEVRDDIAKIVVAKGHVFVHKCP